LISLSCQSSPIGTGTVLYFLPIGSWKYLACSAHTCLVHGHHHPTFCRHDIALSSLCRIKLVPSQWYLTKKKKNCQVKVLWSYVMAFRQRSKAYIERVLWCFDGTSTNILSATILRISSLLMDTYHNLLVDYDFNVL
jgi:hypothetical protein